MVNYFDLVEVEVAFVLDQENLKQSYQSLAAKQHPDQGGDVEVFEQLNQAYQCLKETHTRLKHILEIQQIEFESRGSLSSFLMDLFIPIGNLVQQTEQHVRNVASAQSALKKAMLAPKGMELQEEVEKRISELESVEQEVVERISPLTIAQLSESHSLETIQKAIRDLVFVAKWKATLKEQYAQLFV